MKQCPQCGKFFPDEVTECPDCGAATVEFEDPVAEEKPQPRRRSRLIYAFAYLSWLVVVPMIEEHNSEFARFHCNQGLVLAFIEILTTTSFGILRAIPVPILQTVLGCIEGAILLACFVFSVIGAVGALTGRKTELPLIGKIRVID